MVRRHCSGRAGLVVGCTVAAVVALARPAAAQGLVQGVVVDASGQPVEGASVVIEAEGTNRHFDMKTNKKGEFMQIGLSSGPYKVTATKDKLTATQQVRVSQGRPANARLVLGAAASPAEAAAVTALRKVLDDAIAASNAGRYDDAIAGFQKALETQPTCPQCYYNIGLNYAQKKDYENAIANYKKAIEQKADYADAYSGLASVYNAQRKFDEAAAASAKAAELATTAGGPGGGSADALFNQGVVLWNGGKVAEAKKAFEAAIQANPNHAEAHYQLGMALVNEGNLAGAAGEFETYLKLAPNGANAATAKSLVEQLKK